MEEKISNNGQQQWDFILIKNKKKISRSRAGRLEPVGNALSNCASNGILRDAANFMWFGMTDCHL